jgi:two-component system, NtrC family, response regulator PilR
MTAAESLPLLVVDDEPDLCVLYELTLVREGYAVETAQTVAEAWELLSTRRFAALITDMRLPDGTGLELLQRLEQAGRPEKTIVITAYGSAENAVEALKAGAYDYLSKPVDLKQFRAVVASALGREPAAGRAVAPHGAVGGGTLARLIGQSEAMGQVRSLIDRVARSMAPVMVNGESGTGKELVARSIHERSPRAAHAFVAVNCGAIPDNLLEAEFFGFRKGSFTGATEDREGFFQAAHGGTLFLDEIGDLPLTMQSKLLRVIQERAVRPIGAVSEAAVNVRLVSATHKDLAAEVRAGRFRQDLFYRLNVIQIRMPPLRERMQDLADICRAVLSRLAREAGVEQPHSLSEAALRALTAYGFPGNVRELENLLHRAVALSAESEIRVADLDLPPADGELDLPEPEPEPAAVPAAAMAPRAGEQSWVPADLPLPSDLQAHLDQVERDILERALEAHKFNRTAAGASLNLSLRQMRYRMARLGVLVGESTNERGETL